MVMPRRYVKEHMARFTEEIDQLLLKKAAELDVPPAVLIRTLVEQGLIGMQDKKP
jgi:hypothetical protein